MNPKLSVFAVVVIVSLIILGLALFASTDLKEPQVFWISVFGFILLINVAGYSFSRLKKKDNTK